MSDQMTWRERAVWLAVIVGLAIMFAWIATLGTVAVLQSHAILTPALVLARALARVGAALALRIWPVLPLALLGGIILALAVRWAVPARRKVRHA
jgi:hypothetical protein